MTFRKTKPTSTKSCAVFGAAMSSLFIGSEIQADILDFTFDGGNQAVTLGSGFFGGNSELLNIDQLFGSTELAVDFGYRTVSTSGNSNSTLIYFRDIFARDYVQSFKRLGNGR